MEKIKFELSEKFNPVNFPINLGFGKSFTNYAFEMDYTPENGWHNPAIKPLENLSLHPATMFLHYGQGIFEGLKAFKTETGDVVIFRP